MISGNKSDFHRFIVLAYLAVGLDAQNLKYYLFDDQFVFRNLLIAHQ
jgi:hypothetical protein